MTIGKNFNNEHIIKLLSQGTTPTIVNLRPDFRNIEYQVSPAGCGQAGSSWTPARQKSFSFHAGVALLASTATFLRGKYQVALVHMVQDLGTFIDMDVQMKSHVVKTTAACFAVGLLRRLRSIRQSVPGLVLQSLLSCLVLSRLDHGNAVLAGISVHFLKRLQSVLNSAARLGFSSSSRPRDAAPASTALAECSVAN